MPTFNRFEDINAWQTARELTREVYLMSGQSGFAKDFALRDQIRRAAISISSNIAEGFERNRNREFYHFLRIAKGSAGELRSQLYAAVDLGYTDRPTFDVVYNLAVRVSREISNLMSYLARCETQSSRPTS